MAKKMIYDMNIFDRLLKTNCFSKKKLLKSIAANLLEKFYSCEINCMEIDKSVLFAHRIYAAPIAVAPAGIGTKVDI